MPKVIEKHGVDGKDLYHQPLRRELPKVPGGK
jgi:hypothetical protein